MQLVINKDGASLNVKEGMFIVKADEEIRTFSIDKVESVLITRNVSLSSAAIRLAVENDIEIIFIDRSGSPYARVWSSESIFHNKKD